MHKVGSWEVEVDEADEAGGVGDVEFVDYTFADSEPPASTQHLSVDRLELQLRPPYRK
jgi:hypothetical protein